ncbi:MAG: hypothetical protein H7343_02195 [Undibacterium sp.]|nr:hypothetical protein [Opitutaceae bacterium]
MIAKFDALSCAEDHLYPRLEKAVGRYWQLSSEKEKFGASISGEDDGSCHGRTRRLGLVGLQGLLCELIRSAGFTKEDILVGGDAALPGYFRPQKKWDIAVVRRGRLYAAIKIQSRVASSESGFEECCEESPRAC